jgi:hypothetical protein
MPYKFSMDNPNPNTNHSADGTSQYEEEETVVRETTTRSVPMHVESHPLSSKFTEDFFLQPFPEFVDFPPQSRFLSSASASLPPIQPPPPPPPSTQQRVRFQPMTVQWDYASPNTISAEQQLQRMDREFQRLAGEMNRMWAHTTGGASSSSSSHPPTSIRPFEEVYTPPYDSRYKTAVERVLNAPEPYRVTGLPNYEAPRGFVRVSPAPSTSLELVPRETAALGWSGAEAHADSWRKRENFHLDNPVVRTRDGRSQFRLEFDLRQFNPEEVQVSISSFLIPYFLMLYFLIQYFLQFLCILKCIDVLFLFLTLC